MKSRLLIIFTIGIIGFTGISFADELSDSPIPEPEQEGLGYTSCGPGTTYQDGMCVVDKIENSIKISTDHSNRWGSPYTYDVESPLKQFKSGISVDEIQCRDSLILVTKHNGSPACVREQSIPKLIERGWIQHDRESDKIIINTMSDIMQSNKNGIVTYNDKWTFINKTVTENNLESFTEMYIQDLKKEYQNDEKITFNLELFGYYPNCIFPSLSLYVDEYPQDPIYTGHVAPHPCPFSLVNKPIIKSWDESDFKFFPICTYQGKYTIVGNTNEFDRVIGSFTCNGEKEFNPPKTVKIIISQGASDSSMEKNFEPSQITLNWGDYIMFVNQDDVSYRITTSYHDPNVGKSYFTLNGGESSDPMKIKYDGTHWLSSKIQPYDKTSIVPWMNVTIFMN